MSGTDRLLRSTAVVFLVVFGFLPIANWIPGGHEAPWYGDRLREWVLDGGFVLGVGVLLAIVSRRVPWLWRPGWFASIAAAAHARPARTAALLGVGAFALYAVIAQVVFSAKPLLIDEIIQVWQARVLASGRLWVPTPEFPEFTSAMNLVDHEGRRFGQFPMGGPAMLALGSLLRAEWLVGPSFGAVSAMLAWALFRRIEPRAGVALGAALLFSLAPFTAFMAGSHMNHVTGLTWLLVAMLGLARATSTDKPRWSDGLLCGLGLGMAATIRPVDAVAFALPAAVWLMWQASRTRWPAAFLASGVGVAVPVALLLMANAATTGHVFLSGYELMWGETVGLGFHSPPWGAPHTPLAGLELLNLYLLRLQLYFLEAPIPPLLPVVVALLLAPKLRGFDRYLLLASALLVGMYWMYWHDGFYLGPRYMYPLLPGLAIWLGRLPRSLMQHTLPFTYRVASYTALAALPLILLNVFAIRARDYHSDLQTMRFDADEAARQQGIRDALILVRESWGAEVMVRLWALGLTRAEAEHFYRQVDTCLLFEAALSAEAEGIRDREAVRKLRPLLADSTRVVPSGRSPDRSVRELPGITPSAKCTERLDDDRSGFTLFTPLLLAGKDGNSYLRDLRDRNLRVQGILSGRPTYLLKPRSDAQGDNPEFVPWSLRQGTTGPGSWHSSPP